MEMGYETGGTPYISRDTEEYLILHTNSTQSQNADVDIVLSGTRFSICFDIDQPQGKYNVSIEWKGQGLTPSHDFDDEVVQALGKRLFGAKDGGVVIDTEVPGFTSVKINNVTYNAHPFFKNDHAWYDWVYLSWDGYADYIPARIEMFFDLTNSEISNVDISQSPEESDGDAVNGNASFRHQFLERTMYAVVWSAQSLTFPSEIDTDHHLPLNLAYRVQLENFRRIVPIHAFVKPCFGMMNMCGLPGTFDRTAIILKDRTEWADYFLSPH
jgi:hypothetical protein